MGRIIELIKSFIKPIEPEKSFDELAVAAGIGAEERAILKKSMGGISWKFDEGNEEAKKTRKSKTSSRETTQIKTEPRTTFIVRKDDFERED